MLVANSLLGLLLGAASGAHAFVAGGEQHVLASSADAVSMTGLDKVIHELKRAEIIPTVLDEFNPALNLTLSWSANATSDLGNTLKPKALQDKPDITISSSSSQYCGIIAHVDLTYTVAITDPDAPSRDDPRWSQVCHWIVTNITASSASFEAPSSDFCQVTLHTHNLKEIMPYKPPGPPKKTGKHRYVMVLLAPANGTTQGLNLSKPKDRKRWGTGKERHGVREWAAENGLAVLGANFIYAQHKKQ